ncbi:MAG TPA: hypothetical protein HA298_04295 [Methanobacteriales archaeon]|nr:hypothetical protein [Methanobacteriales archaeon]
MRKIKKRIIHFLMISVIAIALSGHASASDLQNITENIATDAQNTLDLQDSQNTLLITTAGPSKYKNSTTEDALQTVKDKIPLQYSNILQLNKPNDPVEFTFVKKENNNTYAIKYTILESGWEKTQKFNIAKMTEAQFTVASRELGYDILTIASAWTAGAPLDMLKIAAWTGTINDGLISAYAATKQFIQNYPLESDTTSYHIITSVGGDDDDVPMFFMDSTPLKRNGNYYNFRSTYTNDPNENIYIWWDADSKTGKLVYWTISDNAKYNGPRGTLTELKHNLELLTLLSTKPASLYKILKVATINDEQFSHLWSTGIDKEYINSLPSLETMKTDIPVMPANDYNSFYENGKKAVEIANQAFKEAGLSPLTREDLLITSAGYSQSLGLTYAAIDGVIDSTGMLLKNIYSLKRCAQTPLWYVFVKKPTVADGPLYAVFIDSEGKIKPVLYNGTNYNVFDISAKNLEGNKGTEGWTKSLAVYEAYKYDIPSYAQQDYYIVSLANQWAIGMPYDFRLAAIGGGCPGSGLTQGYVIADLIKTWLPLTGTQYYVYIGVPAHCKEQAIMQVLGLSAAKGTYHTTGVRDTAALPSSQGIAIRWDPLKNTGKAILIDYNKKILTSIQPYNNNYYRTMYWAMWYITSAFPGKELYTKLREAYSIKKETTLTKPEYCQLLAAGDPVEYLLNFKDVTPPEIMVTVKDSTVYMDINEEGSIFYSTDGSTWHQYINPIELEKTATIYYYGVDVNGNRAETQQITIPIKTEETQPTTPVISTPRETEETQLTQLTTPVISTPRAQPSITQLTSPFVTTSAPATAPTPQPPKKASHTSPHKPVTGISSTYLALIAMLIIAAGTLIYIKRSSIFHAINNVKSVQKGK